MSLQDLFQMGPELPPNYKVNKSVANTNVKQDLLSAGSQPEPSKMEKASYPSASQALQTQTKRIQSRQNTTGTTKDDKEYDKLVRSMATSPEQYALIQDMMFGKEPNIQQLPGMYGQKAGIADLNTLLTRLYEDRQDPMVDFSPLMNWVDQEYGTNLLKGYKPPPTRRQMLAQEADILGKLQAGMQKLTDDEVALANALMGDRFTQGTQQAVTTPNITVTTDRNEKTEQTPNYGKTSGGKDKDQYLTKTKMYSGLQEALGYQNKLRQYRDKLLAVKKDPSPANLLSLKSAAANMITEFNRVDAKLGALAGADLNIIQKGIADPTSLGNLAQSGIAGIFAGKTPLDQALDQALEAVERSQGNLKDAFEGSINELQIDYDSGKSREILNNVRKRASSSGLSGAPAVGGSTGGLSAPSVTAPQPSGVSKQQRQADRAAKLKAARNKK